MVSMHWGLGMKVNSPFGGWGGSAPLLREVSELALFKATLRVRVILYLWRVQDDVPLMSCEESWWPQGLVVVVAAGVQEGRGCNECGAEVY